MRLTDYQPLVSYLYNTEDERVMKISPQGVTRYITDGNGQKLAKADVTGTKEYFHNDYLPIRRKYVGGGSVRRISGENGGLEWSRDYYPFGETREAGGANEDNFYTYEGKVEDPDEQSDFGEKDLETDLWNNWKRHFNDEGRFTQIDPLWSKYPSLSPYVRVANNPLKYIDPTGLYYVYELDEEGNRKIDPESGEEIKYWVIDVNVEGDGNDVTSYTGEGWDWDIASYENYSGADAVWDAFKFGVGGAVTLSLGAQLGPVAWNTGIRVMNAVNPQLQGSASHLYRFYLGNKPTIDSFVGGVVKAATPYTGGAASLGSSSVHFGMGYMTYKALTSGSVNNHSYR